MASYPHKTKKAGHQRPSAPPASRYSLVFKAFSYAKLKSPQPIVSSTEDFRGAGDGARTRYLHLGKVALYQMSYARRTLVIIAGVSRFVKGEFSF